MGLVTLFLTEGILPSFARPKEKKVSKNISLSDMRVKGEERRGEGEGEARGGRVESN